MGWMVPWSRTVWITTSCTNVTTGKANDIWCIGVSAFCILCGYPPFYGETEIEVLLKIRQQSFSIGIPFISMSWWMSCWSNCDVCSSSAIFSLFSCFFPPYSLSLSLFVFFSFSLHCDTECVEKGKEGKYYWLW